MNIPELFLKTYSCTTTKAPRCDAGVLPDGCQEAEVVRTLHAPPRPKSWTAPLMSARSKSIEPLSRVLQTGGSQAPSCNGNGQPSRQLWQRSPAWPWLWAFLGSPKNTLSYEEGAGGKESLHGHFSCPPRLPKRNMRGKFDRPRPCPCCFLLPVQMLPGSSNHTTHMV